MADRDQPGLSCCLTFDFDAMSLWIGSFASNNPSMISRGEFGAAVGVPRILELLGRYGAHATFGIPGHSVLAYPDVVERIAGAGHEIAHHGWVHENPANFDRADELRNLERGLAAIEQVAGARPRGYRSPAWDFSQHTIDLLLEHGFEYDSSCMGNDFYPYYLRRGDQWSANEPYRFGELCDLVEVPVTWGLDDFPPFDFVWGQNPGLSSPSAVEELWRGDFDYAYAHCEGGVFDLTMHPQVIGRGHRMLLLERLVEHIAGHDGVVFETLGEVADRFRASNPREQWAAENPVYTGANARTSL